MKPPLLWILLQKKLWKHCSAEHCAPDVCWWRENSVMRMSKWQRNQVFASVHCHSRSSILLWLSLAKAQKRIWIATHTKYHTVKVTCCWILSSLFKNLSSETSKYYCKTHCILTAGVVAFWCWMSSSLCVSVCESKI